MTTMLYRTLECEVRGIDEEARTATFTAATERACDMGWLGKEVLRMSGVDLARFKKNPVFLDSHNYSEAGAVVGKGSVKKIGRTLEIVVTYATTDRAERIWELVRTGFLHGVSIGYTFEHENIKMIGEGESDGRGDAKFEGPGYVVQKWQLLEVSQVSVPMDEDAVRQRYIKEMRVLYPETNVEGSAPPKPAEPEKTSDDPKGIVTKLEITEETRARVAEARRREVLAYTPPALREHAENLLLDLDADGKSLTVGQIRTALLAERDKTMSPVGSDEPKVPGPAAPEEVTVDAFVRAINGGV